MQHVADFYIEIRESGSLLKEICKLLFLEHATAKTKLCNLASVTGGYAFCSESYTPQGKYRIVTIRNVTGERYISGEYNSIDELPNNLQKQQILNNGDILISLTGNVGRISIVNGDNCLLNQRVAKLCVADNALKEYIYQYLSQSSFEKDMISAGQGAAQKNIKNNDILHYEIYIPKDKDSMAKIVRFLLLIDRRIMQEETFALKLQQQKSYLLNAMFI